MFDALMGIFQTSPPDGEDNKFKQVLVDIKGRLVTATTVGGVEPLLDGDGHVQVDVLSSLVAGEAHVGEVGGKGLEDRDSFVRPANTDIYTAADVIAETTNDTDTTPLRSLALARISGGSGWLTAFMLAVDHTAFIVRVRVHLFTGATPPTALAGDNAPFAELSANVAEYIGSFDLPTTVLSAGAGADMVRASRDDLRIPFVASDANIYYRLETLDADTPANAATFRITARSDVD